MILFTEIFQKICITNKGQLWFTNSWMLSLSLPKADFTITRRLENPDKICQTNPKGVTTWKAHDQYAHLMNFWHSRRDFIFLHLLKKISCRQVALCLQRHRFCTSCCLSAAVNYDLCNKWTAYPQPYGNTKYSSSIYTLSIKILWPTKTHNIHLLTQSWERTC